MRIADRYDRFTDRVATGKAAGPGAAAVSKADAQGAAAKAAAARGEGAGVLSVKVSDAAATLAAGTARLDELKSQIAKGTFTIDPRAIAKSIVGGDES